MTSLVPAIFLLLFFSAQPGVPKPVRIVAGTKDASPQAVSLIRLDVDLRAPSGFESVYEVPVGDAFVRGESVFMRIDGAVTAVFPRSVYTPAVGGTTIEVPPGTVFWIGQPPASLPPASHVSDTFLNLAEPDPVAPAPAAPAVSRVNSMITDEDYRRRRVEALLSRAADEQPSFRERPEARR